MNTKTPTPSLLLVTVICTLLTVTLAAASPLRSLECDCAPGPAPAVFNELFTMPHGVNEFDVIWDDGAYHWVYSDYTPSFGPLNSTHYRTAATIAGLASATDVVLLGEGWVCPSIQHFGDTWHLWVGNSVTGQVQHFTSSAAAGPYTYSDTVSTGGKGDPHVRYRAADGLYYFSYTNTSTTNWTVGVMSASTPAGPWTNLTGDVAATVGRVSFDTTIQADPAIFFLGDRAFIPYAGNTGSVTVSAMWEVNPATWQATATGTLLVAPLSAWQQRNGGLRVQNPVYIEHDHLIYYNHNAGYSGAWYNVATGWGFVPPPAWVTP